MPKRIRQDGPSTIAKHAVAPTRVSVGHGPFFNTAFNLCTRLSLPITTAASSATLSGSVATSTSVVHATQAAKESSTLRLLNLDPTELLAASDEAAHKS
jgi:hypothetical protein